MIQQKTAYHCVVFGSAEDVFCHQIAQNTQAINLTGQLSLNEVVDTIKFKCEMTVANDTGLMHISDAVGVPTCALFGPTTPTMTGYPPMRSNSFIADVDLWCRPCSRKGSGPCIRIQKQKCLKHLTPEMVFARCQLAWGWTCSSSLA